MRINGRDVIEIVASFYGKTPADFRGPSRKMADSVPRQVCMYMLRRHCKHLSYPMIGALLCKDHSSVVHGDQKIKRLRAEDTCFAFDLDELDRAIVRETVGMQHISDPIAKALMSIAVAVERRNAGALHV